MSAARHLGRRAVSVLPAVVAFGLAAIAWQLFARARPYDIPTLGTIFSTVADNRGLLAGDAAVTIREALVGLACGFVVAFAAAVAMSQVRVLERAFMPVAVVVNVTPILAIAPLMSALFGLGYSPKYILTALIVFFPFLINANAGLRAVDPQTIDVLVTLNASRLEILRRLRLPSSLPYLFAAARVCFPLSVVGAVVSEWSASGTSTGLGEEILVASNHVDLGLEYASVLLLAVMGIVFTAVVVVAERRLLSWHASARRAAS